MAMAPFRRLRWLGGLSGSHPVILRRRKQLVAHYSKWSSMGHIGSAHFGHAR
ncbi:hypothetical protein FQN55_005715 [Onygenales sp. PD_40]|nr:hypothetical protein FQN55_005715 [Onygenales sp. PD_40]